MTNFSNREIIALLDLTSLNDDDTAATIAKLCAQAAPAQVAAVCVFPAFVAQARAALPQEIGVATVVNFPTGNESRSQVLAQTTQALEEGANEIDLVLPYHTLQSGDRETALQFVRTIGNETHAHEALLKTILETGALNTREAIIGAAELAIEAGTDFLKTSTGKIAQGATPEAVRVLAEVVAAADRTVGIKVSGGVRRKEEAQAYLDIIAHALGRAWISPEHVRFGASSLLSALL